MSRIISDFQNKSKKLLLQYGFYFIFFMILIVMGIVRPTFFSLSNLYTILEDSSMFLIAAAGCTLVIVTGNLDMSVGSIAFMSTAIIVYSQNANIDPGIAVALSLGFGILAGAVNGFLVAKLKLNSMLTTLGLMIAYRGLGQIITGGRGQVRIASEISDFGKIRALGGLSAVFILVFICMIILHVLLTKTRFGAYSYAVGNNKRSAEIIGLPVDKVIFWVYVISGFCGSLSGLATLVKLGTYTKYAGLGLEFRVIAAIVIGGASLYGGKGKVLPGTFFGVILLMVISNSLTFLGASVYLYQLVQGMVIFIAMYFDSLSSKLVPEHS